VPVTVDAMADAIDPAYAQSLINGLRPRQACRAVAVFMKPTIRLTRVRATASAIMTSQTNATLSRTYAHLWRSSELRKTYLSGSRLREMSKLTTTSVASPAKAMDDLACAGSHHGHTATWHLG